MRVRPAVASLAARPFAPSHPHPTGPATVLAWTESAGSPYSLYPTQPAIVSAGVSVTKARHHHQKATSAVRGVREQTNLTGALSDLRS